MRAIVITRPGGPEVLELRDVAKPVPGVNQLLVRVHATAVNRADLLQTHGRYPVPPGAPQDIPGLEYAGVIEACGADVTDWQVGDRVMGLVGGGAYAEYVVVHEGEAIRMPSWMDFVEAAAVPEAFITAHDAMFTQMRPVRGETVVIHAVGSGVGTAALQLARERGARVIGTQRSPEKLRKATSLGLEHGVDASSSDFADVVMELTDGRGADGILDLVGGNYLAGNLRCIALRGRILLVGLVAGAKHELDMRRMLDRRVTLIGTVLRARPLAEKIEVTAAFARNVLPLLEQRRVRPVIDSVMPLEEAAEAHRVIASNRTFGKVVLSV